MLPSITLDQLNRAVLARQMLITRENITPLGAIERLVGLQAQVPRPPYIGLWARLANFDRADLTALLVTRKAVRATTMRGTIHLMSARDYVQFRPVLQSMLGQGLQSIFAEVGKLDLSGIVAAARARFVRAPCTFDTIRTEVGKQFPKVNDRLIGYAVRMHLPLVQVPTDASWGYPAAAEFAVAEDWLGAPITRESDEAGPLVLRYLAAFGPASVADAQAWTGLRGLRETFDRLRPNLVVFKGERRTELFDLPDAPRPSAADLPDVPVRFLPDFDNLLLAYADRSRIVDQAHRPRLTTKNLLVPGTFLVDGRIAGIWKVSRKRGTATQTLDLFGPQPKNVRKALEVEGAALAKFVEPDATTIEVQFAGA